MTHIKTAGVAAGFALALVVGVLAGGVLSTAQAEEPLVEYTPKGDVVRPAAADGSGVPSWVLDALEERFGVPEADSLDGEPEAVQCSIVDGCTVEVVDAEGKVIKVMNITFTDAGEPEVDAEE